MTTVNVYLVPLVLIVVAILGYITYMRTPADTRTQEIGRITYFAAVFVLLLWFATGGIGVFHPAIR